jgi:mannose-6-phosphate isomerase-like protein (cupin superfamily)
MSVFELTITQEIIMHQIRPLQFHDFKEEKLQQGYREVLERRWDPNFENEFHEHEFTADALVIEGEFWLTVEGKTNHLIPGDSFHVPAKVTHKEKYGSEGCVFWVARV